MSSFMTVEWLTSGGSSIVPITTVAVNNNSVQYVTLEVEGHDVDQDKTYTCRVSSWKYPDSPSSETAVHLNVYQVTGFSAEVKSGADATISCVIEDITSQVEVEWVLSSGNVIVTDNNYTPNSGTLENNRQTTTLEVRGATQDTTFTCRVRSRQFDIQSLHYTDDDVQITVYGCLKDPKLTFTAGGNPVDKVKIGEAVTVTCAPGYSPSGPNTVTTTTATCVNIDDMEFNDASFDCDDTNSCRVREQLPPDLDITLARDMWADGDTGEVRWKCEAGSVNTTECSKWKCDVGKVKCSSVNKLITEIEFCKICPPKTYHDSSRNICEKCPVGHKSGYGYEKCFSKYIKFNIW